MTAKLHTAHSHDRLLRFHDGERVDVIRQIIRADYDHENITLYAVRTPAGRMFTVSRDELAAWREH